MLAAGFVNDSIIPGSYTLDQLMAVSPALYPRRYAWCTDLFGGSPDWCISDGTQWKPVRPVGLQTPIVNATGAMTLTAMASAPTQVITGVLAVGATLTLSFATQYAWKGASFRTIRKATGLGAVLVNGVGLPLNNWQDHEFDGTAWVQTASGGLL